MASSPSPLRPPHFQHPRRPSPSVRSLSTSLSALSTGPLSAPSPSTLATSSNAADTPAFGCFLPVPGVTRWYGLRCLPLGVCGQEGEGTGERCEPAPRCQLFAIGRCEHRAVRSGSTEQCVILTDSNTRPLFTAWLLRWPAPSAAQLVSVTMMSVLHHRPCWRLCLRSATL